MTNAEQLQMAVSSGTYNVDPIHSRVGFGVKHLGTNRVRGRLEAFEGFIEVEGDVSTAKVSDLIEAESVNTDLAMSDEHFRTADFFDVQNHPRISFTASTITPLAIDAFEITIRGVTKPITLSAQLGGIAEDHYRNTRLGLLATGQLSRSDFGIPYDQSVAGIPLVADTITVELDLEAIKQPS